MSFIASLAAVGTAVGVTGAIAAPLAGAGVLAAGGAGLGAATSAAMGGDPGEGAMMGAITGPLMAPLMPAGAAAEAGTQVATQAGTQAGAQAAEQAGAQAAIQAGTQGAQQAGIQALNQGALQSAGTGLTSYGLGAAPGTFTGQVTGGALANVPGGVSQAAVPFLDTLAGKAVTGAGIGALGGAITNPNDPLKGAAIGAGAGALGGYGAGALAQGAGSSVLPSAVGEFATAHPHITSGLISVPTSIALNSMTTPDAPLMPDINKGDTWSKHFNYAPKFNYNYAAGGITDLDTYTSQAQNTPTGGITQIPNPADVADPEGYGQDSMRMMAQGGIADLGGYAVGGRPNLLHGAGDGVSDDIPATIAGKQPARLAAGEYVVPSRIVSELGNGSTDAGAQRLDAMVQKIQAGRRKTIGSKKQFANDTKAYKHLPI